MGLWSKDWTLLCNWNFKTLHKFSLGMKVYILMQLARIHICKVYFYIINNILWWHRYIHYTWAFIWPHTQTLLALLVYVLRKIICFSCWNLPNHGTACHALATIKAKYFREIGESCWYCWKSFFEWVGFLGGDFVIFKPKVREILNFE